MPELAAEPAPHTLTVDSPLSPIDPYYRTYSARGLLWNIACDLKQSRLVVEILDAAHDKYANIVHYQTIQ